MVHRRDRRNSDEDTPPPAHRQLPHQTALTGENEQEHEREGAGDPTPADPSMPEFIAEPGDSSALEPADESGAASAAEPPRARRFGAWGAAQREESGPSLWHRASQKIKGIFSRKKDVAQDEEFVETAASNDDLPYLVAPDEHASEDARPETLWPTHAEPFEPTVDHHVDAPVDATVTEPKEDLKFLWNGEDAAADASAVSSADAPEVEAFVTEVPTGAMDAPEMGLEAADEPPREKRPSFFKRLFGFKSKAGSPEEIPDTGETEISVAADSGHDFDTGGEEPSHAESAPESEHVDEPQHEPDEPALAATQAIDVGSVFPTEIGATQPIDVSSFTEIGATQPIDVSSLDVALPMDASSVDEPYADAALEGSTETLDGEPQPELPKKPGFFARLFGRKSTEAPPPIEPEVESEPEPDAVEQLDAVDEGFEVARSEFAPPEHPSGQAFATVDDALPFDTPTFEMQPAITEASFAPPAPPSARPSGDEHMFFGGNTFDFESPKSDDRATKEVTPAIDERKTAEVTAGVVAHADEVQRKTDEFEMVDMATLQEPAVSPMEGKTAEVPKVGFIKKLFGRTKEVTQVEAAVAPPPSANPTFLVQKFRTFYNEVVVFKNQKTEFAAGFSTAIVTDYTADLSPEQAAQTLAMRLQQMLELQLAESSWMGGEIHELYPDAHYSMACLADEMLTHLEWPGQLAWGRHRLELTIFKTVASDVEVFKRMDKLLKNGPRTVGTRDLARLYLLVVASGFKGKYRPFGLPRALADYRRRLYEFVYGGDALLLYGGDRRIFPEAESATVAGRGVKRFSLAQQWAAILVLLLASYTLVSHLAWKKVSADLKDIAARVEQARRPAAPDTPNGGGGR